MLGTPVGHFSNVLYTVSTRFILSTAPAGRHYYHLSLQGERAWATCLKCAVSVGTVVWIHKAWLRTSAHNRCPVWPLLGCQGLVLKPHLCFPSLNSWSTALLALGRPLWKSFSTDLVGRIPAFLSFLSCQLPRRERCVCVCRVLRWLWKKHMELWYEHNGQGLMLIFFSTLVHSAKSERFHLVPLLHICCFNSEVLGFI